MWRANDFHLALQLTCFYVPVKTILRAKWSRGRERGWGGGKRGGNKDRCEEGVYQSMSTMAIINHQLCYFLSGDYLGEEGPPDEKGGKRLFDTERCAREVFRRLRCDCTARPGFSNTVSHWSF